MSNKFTLLMDNILRAFCTKKYGSTFLAGVLVLGISLPAAGQFRVLDIPDASSSRSGVVTVKDGDAKVGVTTGRDPIPDNDSTVGVQGGRYGVGFGSSWPAYGLSGTIQISETITGEAILGFFGDVTNFGGRVWYRFNRSEKYDIYAYGGIGVYRYKGFDSIFLDLGVSESVLGVGLGAGVESGLAKLFDDEEFPPIFVSAELGIALASFEYYGGFSTISLGFGIHYRFGKKG
ncbi:MAG: hypothetical protein AB8G77_22080 [Rhodothermales bacterium]